MTHDRRIERVLIANRTEIASRVIRTCRAMGIDTVAVFSEADRSAPFVREADEAVCIGPAASRESYLSIEKIVDAAKATGADAIHPGFGFLAENADFARAVEAAGLVWIGPPVSSIEAMGKKREAKELAQKAGVPVIEGFASETQDAESFLAAAERIGYPVLLKASAGGGGKGMRIVRAPGELDAALASTKREAASSFGDDTILLEKYVERPRHIEIQIFGDRHGNVVHLFERECSIQRRHQKIVEESPSVALTDSLRAEMGAAAVALAHAIAYEGAGTVEMIVDQAGKFYFLEVNTRLQVEHPVTEAITGLDLVELQLRIARGEPLPFTQGDVPRLPRVAIECRLYAEDPDGGFLPQTGTLTRYRTPRAEWLRVDSGVAEGSEVTVHYDPMLAKVIAWGSSRADAIRRMRWALERTEVLPVITNRDFLLRVLAEPAYERGEIHTHFIDEHLAERAEIPNGAIERAAIAVTLAEHARRAAERQVLPSVRTGYRNNRFADPSVEYRYARGDDEVSITIAYRDLGGGRFAIRIGDAAHEARVLGFADDTIALELDGRVRSVPVIADEGSHAVVVGAHTVRLEEVPRFVLGGDASAQDGAVAPMPGKIVDVAVAVGDAVTAGQPLVVMEAMKMEHTISAPHDGTVREVRVTVGEQVSEGALLVLVIDESGAAS
ncbi:MAG: biotin carboxylase N-terminal domain-containing protein [Sandaracinaceae bacterium]